MDFAVSARTAGVAALLACTSIATTAVAAGLPSQPVDPSSWTEDATRDVFSESLELAWGRQLGDWVDAAGTPWGSEPFAAADLRDTNSETVVEWDVTALVRAHGAEFGIRRSGGVDSKFHSREAADVGKRPVLVVTKGGASTSVSPVADTYISSSTADPMGKNPTMSTRTGPMLLRFDVGADAGITKAVLRMTSTDALYGHQRLLIMRPTPIPSAPPALSLPLGSSSDVVLRLKGETWRPKLLEDRQTIQPDGSLVSVMPVGDAKAASGFYMIPRGERRDTMFARFVMKIHMDWDADTGGKWPGLANTGHGITSSGIAAWGGRFANGVQWSARTNRKPTRPGTQFAATHQGWGTYVYRLNRKTSNGDVNWSQKPLTKGRFLVIDQMVKLNSIDPSGVAQADGEIAYWLDGELVNRLTGIVFRSRLGDDTLPESVWMDVYEGGVGYKAPHPHTVTYDEVLVSRKLMPFDRNALDRLNANTGSGVTPAPAPAPIPVAVQPPAPAPIPVAVQTPSPAPAPVPVVVQTPAPVTAPAPAPAPTPVVVATPAPPPTPAVEVAAPKVVEIRRSTVVKLAPVISARLTSLLRALNQRR